MEGSKSQTSKIRGWNWSNCVERTNWSNCSELPPASGTMSDGGVESGGLPKVAVLPEEPLKNEESNQSP